MSSFATGPDSCFGEFHPSVTVGVFVSFLIFCESLALDATSRGVIIIIITRVPMHIV